VFLVLSAILGPPVALLNPPLRGPDELAHYLRAYGIAQGEVIARTERNGQLGLLLPAALHREIATFEAYRERARDPEVSYRDVLREMREAGPGAGAAADAPPVFTPYQGSESYNPVAYVPHVLAQLVADALGLGFLPASYLMRLFGLAAFTALTAWAIALTPRLKWTFVAIGLWPASLYGRAVISADGPSLAFLMLALALCLATLSGEADRPAARSLWLTLTALAKPPQLAFVLIELGLRPLRPLWQGVRRALPVMLPALILGPAWAFVTAAEVAAWRMTDDNDLSLEEFDPVWKLGYMLEHPLHFPGLLAANLEMHWGRLLREVVGVHGWLDTPLHPLCYVVLPLLLLATLEPLGLAASARRRMALVSGVVMVVYWLGVYVIFYLIWTPLAADNVYGVQGRYFVVLLPLAAIMAAAALDRPPLAALAPAAAVAGALISGIATLEALWRVNWT
jgi:uncharacterized membrane protein